MSLTIHAAPPVLLPDALGDVRLFVADDHDLHRAVVVAAVHRHPALTLVGEAADGEAALDGILDAEPDVALLDARMPGPDGLAVCRQVRDELPGCAVVILTAFDDDDVVERAEAAGAAVCLGKDASEEEICAAVIAAADGAQPVRWG